MIDTHTTNGSYHRYTLTYDGPRNAAAPAPLISFVRDDFLPEVGQRMEQATGYKSFYYGNFNSTHEQWETYPARPRYGTQYVAVRGRIGILSEAYAYASYRDRVLVTREFVLGCARLAVEKADSLRQMLQKSRDDWNNTDLAAESPPEIPIQSEAVPLDRQLIALGFDESTLDASTPRGTLPERPQDYAVRFIGLEQPTVSVTRPYAYLIPPHCTHVLENLQQHGLELELLREELDLELESYRLDEVQRAEEEFQQHHLVRTVVTKENRTERVPAGTLVLRTAQDLGRLGVLLLEPASQDGLVTWNFFDEELEVGTTFPVKRLPRPVPLLLAKYRRHSGHASVPKKPITYEAVYGKDRVNLNGAPVSGVRWLPTGEHYLLQREGQWLKVHAESGRSVPFFATEALQSRLQKLPGLDRDLAKRMTRQLTTDESYTTAIWERDGDLYASRLDGSGAKRLTAAHAKDELATLSPDGKRVAFVRDFDLFAIRSNGRGERQLTVGGNPLLRRGKADWVYYEEIYGRQWQAYRWSPDSRRIAFLEFDDSPVQTFIVLDHTPHRLNVENERYPKAGDPIPQVRLGVVRPDAGDVQWIQLDGYSAENLIVTRYGWLPDSKRLFVYVQDRAQRWLDMLLVDVDANRGTPPFPRRDAGLGR